MPDDFESWIRANFTGVRMDGPPDDFDPQRELFYRIGDLQHRVPFTAIPDRFLTEEERKQVAKLKES